ncbi:ficolin-1-like [Drosophila innubila]|uniref:ficolin-1-like n=1 Tax=Drosophila innubila TaxID=198719 RepID=UPI00148B38A8|nr:ficolin-1-like [Drosophila innubila]
MWKNLICLIFVVSSLVSFSSTTRIPERDNTDTNSLTNSQFAELRAQQRNSDTVIGGLFNALKAEQERQRKLTDELVQESAKRNSFFNPHNCTEAKFSGIYDIVVPNLSSQPFKVECDANTRGGGWTIILRRMDGSIDFYRNWAAYKKGFGELYGEFFLGLDKIHALTADGNQELLVVLEDFKGNEKFELYDSFAIGDEDQEYALHTLGEASGTAGDSLRRQYRMAFSTYDRDNDIWQGGNCATSSLGAWWYASCHDSNLAGTYDDDRFTKGVNWVTFKGYEYSLKKAVMMIRTKK